MAEYLDYDSPDGCIIGRDVSSKLAFYGVTATVTQPSGAAQAAVVTTAATTGAATYGFTSAQANSIVALLNQIRSDLVTLGLLKGS